MNSLYSDAVTGCLKFVPEITNLKKPISIRFSKYRNEAYQKANPSKYYHPTHSGYLIINTTINEFSLYLIRSGKALHRRKEVLEGKDITIRVVKKLTLFVGSIQNAKLNQIAYLFTQQYVLKRMHDISLKKEEENILIHRQLNEIFPDYVSAPFTKLQSFKKNRDTVIEMMQKAYYSDFYHLLDVIKKNEDTMLLFLRGAKFLEKLHDMNFVFGDTKPPNFLIELGESLPESDNEKTIYLMATDVEDISFPNYIENLCGANYYYFDALRLKFGLKSFMTDVWGWSFSFGNWLMESRLEKYYNEHKSLNSAAFTTLLADIFLHNKWISEECWKKHDDKEFFDNLTSLFEVFPLKGKQILLYARWMKRVYTSLERMELILTHKSKDSKTGLQKLIARQEARKAAVRDKVSKDDLGLQKIVKEAEDVEDELSDVQVNIREFKEVIKTLILLERSRPLPAT